MKLNVTKQMSVVFVIEEAHRKIILD